MDKVHCLKKLYTKLTGKEITDPEVDTICEVLRLLGGEISSPVVGATANFARKETSNGKVLLGYDGNISIFLELANGQHIPVSIAFTDIE